MMNENAFVEIAAILGLVALTTFGSSVATEGPAYFQIVLIGTKGLGMLVIVGSLMKYVIPYLLARLAHSLELLTLFAIAWAVSLGAGSEILGFSKEIPLSSAGVSVLAVSRGGRVYYEPGPDFGVFPGDRPKK